MKRRQHRSPEKEGMVRRNGHKRQRNAGHFRWDSDLFSSDSSSSVSSIHSFNLTKTSTDLNPEQDCVVLSDSEDDEVQVLDPAASAQAQKVVLASGAKAADTLETLRQVKESRLKSIRHLVSHSKKQDSDESIVSGPSSPSSAPNSKQCDQCQRLFCQMKKRRTSKNKKRSTDPASLSCDEWTLKKKWRPQHWQQVRGRLWVHLKRIRAQAAARLDSCKGETLSPTCCRPHIFLQRNLQRCMKRSSKSMSQPKPTWPSLQGPNLRLSTEAPKTESTSPQTFPSTFSRSTTSLTLQRQEEVVTERNREMSRTCRVLKFDVSFNTVQEKTQKRGEAHKRESSAVTKHVSDWARLIGDSDGFTTPDLSRVESEGTKRSQSNTFRSMLAVLEKSQSRITKEVHY